MTFKGLPTKMTDSELLQRMSRGEKALYAELFLRRGQLVSRRELANSIGVCRKTLRTRLARLRNYRLIRYRKLKVDSRLQYSIVDENRFGLLGVEQCKCTN